MVIYFPVIKYLYFGTYKQPVFQITGYIAAVVGLYIAYYLLNQEKQKLWDIAGSMIAGGIGVFLGARLFYFFGPWTMHYSWTITERLLRFSKFWTGGLVMYGGLLGGMLVLYAYIRWKRLSVPQYFDIYAIMFAVTLLIARFGCLLSYDHPAKETNLAFGVVHYTHPGLLPFGLSSGYKTWVQDHAVYPSDILYILYMAVLVALLFYIYFHIKPDLFRGHLAMFTAFFYPLNRFLNEFLRSYSWHFFGLTASQLVCIVILAIALVMLHRKGYNLITFLKKLFTRPDDQKHPSL